MLEQYPNDVKVVYKSFPLRNHKMAQPAALAALAAGKQGKFWEMHDLIFEDYKNLSEQKFKDMATKLGLDMDKFEQDLKDQGSYRMIQADLQNGFNSGVTGTPTIFINGRLLKNRSVDGMKQLIDKELAAQNK